MAGAVEGGAQSISLNLNKNPQVFITPGIPSRNSTADETKAVSQNKSRGWVLDPGSPSSSVPVGELTRPSELQFPRLWFRGDEVEPAFQDCCEGRGQHRVQKPLQGPGTQHSARRSCCLVQGAPVEGALGTSQDAAASGTVWG